MAKYLIEASYTTEGVRGLLKDGGTKRREAIQTAVKKAGGKLEGFGGPAPYQSADAPL